MWGLKDERPEEGKDKGFVSPIFDDGLLEVVGLEGGWKSWAALSGVRHNLHPRRVAQANELKITYHSPKGISCVCSPGKLSIWLGSVILMSSSPKTCRASSEGCAAALLAIPHR